ncbi:MAG TPA: GNAT family protein, partial [Candidatus Eremiobacteraceae bacterium]|nr:GNAT family protein [Candidatus Eremiobacteraceae bacterium]
MPRTSDVGPLGVRVVARMERHLAEIQRGFDSGVVASNTIYHLPRSLSVDEASLAETKRRRDRPQYSIMAGRRVVGVCSLRTPVFAGAELTIAIFDADYRGAGVGTFAVRTLCATAFYKLHVGRVELGVYPENERAIRCYERCGFAREAVLRRFIYH